jgi:hypothetical protein
LVKKTDIVAARPVLNDESVNDTPEVNKGPRNSDACGGSSSEQRHRRGPVIAVQGDMLSDALAVSDQMVCLDTDIWSKIVIDDGADLS